MREWAYAHRYESSEERAQHLPRWIHEYNWHRRHGSLGGKPPISVLGLKRCQVLARDHGA